MENDQGGHGDHHGVDLLQTWLAKETALRRYACTLIARGGTEVMDADDLMQNTFINFFTNSKSPEGVRKPVNYLFRVLHNQWVDDLVRSNKVRTEPLDQVQDDPAQRGKLPAIQPEVIRDAEEEEQQRREEERRRNWERLRSSLTTEEKDLLEAWLKDELEQYAVKNGLDIYRVRASWYKLRAKLNRLAKIKGMTPQGKAAAKQSTAPNGHQKDRPDSCRRGN